MSAESDDLHLSIKLRAHNALTNLRDLHQRINAEQTVFLLHLDTKSRNSLKLAHYELGLAIADLEKYERHASP